MWIEALPSELLVQIFACFHWKELSTILSLVNRRWYQVIGTTSLINRVTLHLSVCVQQPLSQRFEDSFIPLEVLSGSLRKYRNFSIDMRTMNSQKTNHLMGPIMECCSQRWKMESLQIVASHGNWYTFLQDHSELLNKTKNAAVIIKSSLDVAYFNEETPPDNHILLSMNEMRHFKYECSDDHHVPYVVTLEAPNLEGLKIKRCLVRNNIHFILGHCSKLRSISIVSESQLCRLSAPDPIELESISAHLQPNLTHLKLCNATMATTFGATFGNLHRICLTNVRIIPTNYPLECTNLRKLILYCLTLNKPLKIKTPQLQSLTCSMGVLNKLQLEEAFQANSLSIDMQPHTRSLQMAYPASFSFFRKINLKLSRRYCYDNTWFNLYSSYFIAATELMVNGEFPKDHYMHMKDLVSHFTQVTSLTLRWMSVPSDFSFLPSNVKAVSLEHCSTKANKITFGPSITRVKVSNMWKWNEHEDNGVEMQLLPEGRFPPLSSKLELVRKGKVMIPRTIYCTVERITENEYP